MTRPPLVEQLLAMPEIVGQRRFLAAHIDEIDDALGAALKAQADQYLRADSQRALQMAELLLHAGSLTANPRLHALGLLAEANVRSIGLGEYQPALALYDQAAAIYQNEGLVIEEARSQIGKVWALACLGRYDEARHAGAWAEGVLREQCAWRPLATLTMNLAIVAGRQGDDHLALTRFDQARDIYAGLGEDGSPFLPWIDQNRAVVLRNLGRFETAIQASHSAHDALSGLGQHVEAARAHQNLALTYFVLGRYNEALDLMNDVRAVFLADGRTRDAVLVDLFVSDCLLQLRRFGDVLDKCQRARAHFTVMGANLEIGQTILNGAIAYAGLARYADASAALAEARGYFVEEDNAIWIATADLEHAAILLRQGALAESGAVLEACIAVFGANDLPVKEAQARLIRAQIAAALGNHDEASESIARVLVFAKTNGLSGLTYQGQHLAGTIAQANENHERALTAYEAAIDALEQLRGRLMIEFRAQFLEDKHAVYEDAVSLCLELGRPAAGLAYAERAKSRALLDLLALRLDVGLRARSTRDQRLVDELTALRTERDRLYRRQETRETVPQRGDAGRVQGDVLALEKRITDLWHQLLIANADYAQDAALWQVQTEPIQPYLASDTVMLEYFIARGKMIAFIITRDAVRAHVLPGTLANVQGWMQRFWLNLRAAPFSEPHRIAGLAENARQLLVRLHEALLAPLAQELAGFRRLIIVPHGPLHYVPFHALHDGSSYLLERCEISYLPGASLLRYCQDETDGAGSLSENANALVYGYSWHGRLPHAVLEATQIAGLLGGRLAVEGEATAAHLREHAGSARILHLATHGDFRPDNPLFSGLALADGWLTTLDAFNLHLRASLVTLSACQTGRSVVAGGDELLGLMRAFLHAGAASLLLSFWPVEDVATGRFMALFYEGLTAGRTKAAALRQTQAAFIAEGGTHAHPYFWAPFLLIGAAGYL